MDETKCTHGLKHTSSDAHPHTLYAAEVVLIRTTRHFRFSLFAIAGLALWRAETTFGWAGRTHMAVSVALKCSFKLYVVPETAANRRAVPSWPNFYNRSLEYIL